MSEATRDPRGVGSTAATTIVLNLAIKYILLYYEIQMTGAELLELVAAVNAINLGAGSTARNRHHKLEAIPEWQWYHWLEAVFVYPAATLLG